MWRLCTHTLTHTATGTYSVMLINPHLHTKDTGPHKDSSLKRRRVHTISNACALLYIGRFENWFSIVGEAVKMTSSYHFWGVFILHLLFSPSHRSLLSGKIRSDPFHKFILFLLSQSRKVQFVYSSFYVFFHLYFCWSYSTAPTAHGRQREREGKGPERRVH